LILSSTTETHQEDSKITVYPNPFTDQIFVNDPKNKINKIEIRNLQGQLIIRMDSYNNIKINNSRSNLIFLAFDNQGNILKRKILLRSY